MPENVEKGLHHVFGIYNALKEFELCGSNRALHVLIFLFPNLEKEKITQNVFRLWSEVSQQL